MAARVLVILVLTGLALVAPASADAQIFTFGSPLTAPPPTRANFGCELEPSTPDLVGNVGFQPSGRPDCTWRQHSVINRPADPRGGYPPGDGVIIQAEVLSGPNPAPLRFVVLTQFDGVCCFFVTETNPIPLIPNGVTPIPLNLPFQRNTPGCPPGSATCRNIRREDLVGVSAASNTGSLPLAEVGGHNSFTDFLSDGSVNASFYYPRMGQIANDSGGGRREAIIPGIEVMVRWTWCAAAQCGLGGPGGAGAPPPPGSFPGPGVGGALGPALLSQEARIARGRALIGLICNGDAACEGRLQLLQLGRYAETAAKKKKKATSYGKSRYNIPAGATATVKVPLSGKAKRALRKRKSVTVALRLTPKGGTPINTKVTLKKR